MMGQPTRGGKPERSKPNWAALRRAMGYNGHYGKIMLIAYGTLIIALTYGSRPDKPHKVPAQEVEAAVDVFLNGVMTSEK